MLDTNSKLELDSKLTKKIKYDKMRQKYEKLRQKQLDIFYRTGKPIYRISLETQFLRNNNTPHLFIEKKNWEN